MRNAGYLVVIEGEAGSYSGYSPDLPGCVAARDTPEEVVQLMREAIPLHIRSLRDHGEPIPPPRSQAEDVVPEAS
jgi:predicted RNase H-like HicB family nuclease